VRRVHSVVVLKTLSCAEKTNRAGLPRSAGFSGVNEAIGPSARSFNESKRGREPLDFHGILTGWVVHRYKKTTDEEESQVKAMNQEDHSRCGLDNKTREGGDASEKKKPRFTHLLVLSDLSIWFGTKKT